MPVIIFILLYITGVMLGFAVKSNMAGYNVNAFFRILMFMKIKKRTIFLHALIFQGLNIILFLIVLTLYFLLSEKNIASVYNIYKLVSAGLFIIIMIIAAVDAIYLEKLGKG